MVKSHVASADEDEVSEDEANVDEANEDEANEDEAHENIVLFSINPPKDKNKKLPYGPSQMYRYEYKRLIPHQYPTMRTQ